jgi:hypothetical protein
MRGWSGTWQRVDEWRESIAVDVVSWSESLLHIAKSFIQITLNRKVIILITGSNKAGVSFNNIAGLSPVYSIATIGATAY